MSFFFVVYYPRETSTTVWHCPPFSKFPVISWDGTAAFQGFLGDSARHCQRLCISHLIIFGADPKKLVLYVISASCLVKACLPRRSSSISELEFRLSIGRLSGIGYDGFTLDGPLGDLQLVSINSFLRENCVLLPNTGCGFTGKFVE